MATYILNEVEEDDQLECNQLGHHMMVAQVTPDCFRKAEDGDDCNGHGDGPNDDQLLHLSNFSMLGQRLPRTQRCANRGAFDCLQYFPTAWVISVTTATKMATAVYCTTRKGTLCLTGQILFMVSGPPTHLCLPWRHGYAWVFHGSFDRFIARSSVVDSRSQVREEQQQEVDQGDGLADVDPRCQVDSVHADVYAAES